MLKHTKHLKVLLEESHNNGKYVSVSRIGPGQEIVAIIRPLVNRGFAGCENLDSPETGMMKMLIEIDTNPEP